MIGALIAVTSGLHAATIIWLGGVGNFENSLLWINGRLPGTSDSIVIDSLPLTTSTVTINTDARLRNITIGTGDSLIVANGKSLELTGSNVGGGNQAGSVVNNGTLRLDASSSLTDFTFKNGTFTFSGTGSLTLSNSLNNRIYGISATDQLVNAATHTIQGSGQLGVNLLKITNQGLILANQSNNLIIDPNAGGVTNTGTMRATNGATLDLRDGTFANAGGLIKADDASRVNLSNVTITGGTLTSVGTGYFLGLGNSTLSGVTILSGSNVQLVNAQQLNLAGIITNAGTIQVASSGSSTDLVIAAGGATLTGDGNVVLTNNANNRIYGASGTTTLINLSNTISGAGQIGVNQLQLDNRGVVDANISGSTLTIDPSGTGVTNTGTLRASNGGILRLEPGTFTNTNGTLLAQNGSRVDFAGPAITGGSLTTTGTGLLRNVSTATLANVTLTTGSTLQGLNATDTTLTGTFTNQGTLTLNSTGSSTDFIAGTGGLTLTGGGSIVLSNNANNRIYGVTGTTTLVNVNNIIRGAGQLGANQLQLDNRHIVDANVAGATLTIDPSGSGATNTGTLRATNGGILRLSGGTYTNAGGIIDVQNASFVDFDGVLLTGGEFTAAGSGVFRNLNASTFTNVLFNSGVAFNLLNGTTATFAGTLTNQGTINLQSSGSNTDFIAGLGGLTLTGGGNVVLGSNANNRIYGVTGSTTLVNLNNVISGAGQLGANQLQLDNRHIIDANISGARLTIDPSGTGASNSGTLRATNGGILQLNGATFNNPGTISASGAGSRVDFNGTVIVGGQLTTTLGASIRNLNTATLTDVALAAILDLQNGTNTTFIGSIANSGTINLQSTGSSTDLIAGSGGTTLSGSGEILLTNNANNRIYGVSGTTTLTNADNVIRGAGQIGANQLQLINHSLIEASYSGSVLTLDPSGSGATNHGTLQASNGGILRLQDGTFTNTASGLVNATGATSRVEIAGGALLQGGTLTGDGLFRVSGSSTLKNLTIASGTVLELPNGATMNLAGSIVNGGTLNLISSGSSTDLIIGTGGATLTGGGEISLDTANANNRLYGVSGSTTLTNIDNTIRGSGQLGANQLTLVNTGTIEANQSTALTVNLSGATPFNNQGTLRATNGASLIFVDSFTNAGSIVVQPGSTLTAQGTLTQTAGSISLQTGTLATAGATAQSGSSLQGAGTITGAFTNGGTIAPGAGGSGTGIGTLTFNQTLTLTNTSLLHFELGGASSFDQVHASNAFLAGSVAVSFANGFQSSVTSGQSFTLLSTTNGTGLTGTFAGVANGSWLVTTDGGNRFQVSYTTNSFTLSNFQPIPEPSTYMLLGTGSLMLLAWYRRRRS